MGKTGKIRWWKAILWVLLTPILLFIALMVLLYVPPVQQVVKGRIASLASEATGWDISIGRMDLRFPLNLLVKDVQVVQPVDASQGILETDTLLKVESLNVRVQARPLFRGRLEVDGIQLKQAKVNTAHLIDGVWVKGSLEDFALRSHGNDLDAKKINVNDVSLTGADVIVHLVESTEPEDTTSTPVDWVIGVEKAQLQRVNVNFAIPADTLNVKAKIQEAKADDILINLKDAYYGLQTFALSDSFLKYEANLDSVKAGIDPSHITLMNLHAQIDSAYYQGRKMHGVVRKLCFDERSGISLTSLTGHLDANVEQIILPDLALATPHSELTFRGVLPWSVLEDPSTGVLNADFLARLGREDLMLAVGNMPESFVKSYPARPLAVRAKATGNLQQLDVRNFSAQLPGSFSLTGEGDFYYLTDSLKRRGNASIQGQTGDLNFLTALIGSQSSNIVIPDSMLLAANVGLEGDCLAAKLDVVEQQGKALLDATYNLATEAYTAQLNLDSVMVSHFLPQDSIFHLSAQVVASGVGFDFAGPRATAKLEGKLQGLHYKNLQIHNVDVQGSLQRQLANLSFTSDNALLKAKGTGQMKLGSRYTEGKIDLDVSQIDLQKLGFINVPITRDMAFTVKAEAGRDSIFGRIDGGDMIVMFRSRMGVEGLMEQGRKFDQLLTQQFKGLHLNHEELREALPQGGLFVRAGSENPVNYYLTAKGLGFNELQVGYGFNPLTGINGRAEVHGLRIDSVRLDTVYFALRQDTSRIALHGAVINGPKHPQITFRSLIDGEIRSEDAGLNLTFEDKHKRTGLLFGVNARPVAGEEEGTVAGVMMHITPEEPIIAFRKFHFDDDKNWVYLRGQDQRVFTEVDLKGEDDLGIMVKSNDEDSLSLQNLNLEIQRLQLSDLSQLFPYMPIFAGITSLDANFVQTATSMQVSAEGLVDEFSYEGRRVGDIGLGATWLPGDEQTHYIDTYLTYDSQEAMTLNGSLKQKGEQSLLDVVSSFEHFPLQMANAFIPDQMLVFSGALEGGIDVAGTLDKPLLNGELTFNDVSFFAPKAGTNYRFDKRPVAVSNSRLLFDKFAIYTTADNPLTIDGNIDLATLSNPMANLRVQAQNYTLLDAVKTKESLLYGKVYVDINATMRGPLLEGPVMRGNMNVLGNTNATYVMTDSPLTVEDRLDGLVTFTSFAEEEQNNDDKGVTMALGGMDMLMTVHIDDAVRLRADLSADRSKYVELTGGGDLSMRYTPQGDLSMTGRYTINNGTMKYSLPVIPLKDFTIANGSYVDWRGDIMNPRLSITATERTRASVSNGGDEGGSRRVDFDVAVVINNTLESPDLSFDLSAPNDAEVQNELLTLSADERGKQAITMLATGIYLGSGMVSGESLTMGTALNSVLQSQINALAGSTMKNANFSMGIENRTDGAGSTLVDYSFRYSQRFFNDRVQINIGGKVTTGSNATNNAESFIDNVSLEYRVDKSGTRYLRAFHNKNYEDLLDGEVTETGVGVLFRKKMDSLSELWIFGKK